MVSVQEYLTTSYEGDRDYVDGEILERHSGEQAHSRAHVAVGAWIFHQEAQSGVRALMSQRLRIGPTRFRVPDVCVLMASDPRDPIVSQPPFLCVEILSSGDTVTRLNEKLADYFQMGVRYVWVLDPLTRRAFCYTPGKMHEVLDGILRTNDPDILVPLDEVFEA
jgi:Uma2 family endonuclease